MGATTSGTMALLRTTFDVAKMINLVVVVVDITRTLLLVNRTIKAVVAMIKIKKKKSSSQQKISRKVWDDCVEMMTMINAFFFMRQTRVIKMARERFITNINSDSSIF